MILRKLLSNRCPIPPGSCFPFSRKQQFVPPPVCAASITIMRLSARSPSLHTLAERRLCACAIFENPCDQQGRAQNKDGCTFQLILDDCVTPDWEDTKQRDKGLKSDGGPDSEFQ